MIKLTPLLLAVLLFTGCSRSGHHPDPIAPFQPTSPYDVRAVHLTVEDTVTLNKSGFGRRGQPVLSAEDSNATAMAFSIENVGTTTLPKRALFFEFAINDQVAWKERHGNSFSISPGESQAGTMQCRYMRIKLNKPGRYEVRLRAWLVERLGETNLDDNVIVQYVDVRE